MDLNLVGRRALVTGGSSGIGAAIARMLAAEGAQVVVHGRDAARAEAVAAQISVTGGAAKVALGDLATPSGAESVAAAARAAFDGVDILVNNIGGPLRTAFSDWFEIPIEDWEPTYQLNVVAAMRMAHAFAPAMRERGWGRIIHISSRNATHPRTTLAAYAASKAALSNMSIGLSKALARTGVTVNTVSPGLIYTPMLDEWLATIGRQQGLGDDLGAAREFVLKNLIHQSVNRLGDPDDIARMVTFIASPSNDFINGADFAVDGGALPAG